MEYSLMMDNDSGYVSHNQESTLDSSISDNLCAQKNSVSSHNLYVSEDALLEKPPVANIHRVESYDSVINSSQESIKTEFSGFEDSVTSLVSPIIPKAKPIVWENSGRRRDSSIMDSSMENYLNISHESNSSLSEGLLKLSSMQYESSSRALKVLANVTNIYDETANQAVIKNVFHESDKENIDPSATPKKQYENRLTSDISPDLFAEEEELSKLTIPIKPKSPIKKKIVKDSNNDKDVKLLKKLQNYLSGVHPPPSLTMIQMTATEMLNKVEGNKHLFWFSYDENLSSEKLNESCDNNFTSIQWPDILKSRHHGLHYNRNKISEEFEHLCSKYAERYVGAETQSTCTVFESEPPSSSKRKLSKPRWMAKSPGRRLSHLARRRITFNSSSLPGTSSAILGSRARQILVDAKRMNMLQKKSPKKSPRKTPSKSPFKLRRNSPSSSAKKKLAMRFREMAGEFRNEPSSSNSFKRALFHSPNHDKSTITSRILLEKKSTKRTLFSSPVKRSPQKSPFKLGKRKRNDVDEENPSKFARSMSLDLRPLQQTDSRLLLNRTVSDTTLRSRTEELSEQHKKKLQWAVYESLRLHNITASHPQFKVFASVLARVTRKFLPGVRVEGRTTEKMLRIARYHSYAVVKGKTVDEIVNEYARNKLKTQKPQGYVGIDDFQNLRSSSATADKENVLQDKANIIESIEKRREHAGSKTKFLNENSIDRIKKVISFDDNSNKRM